MNMRATLTAIVVLGIACAAARAQDLPARDYSFKWQAVDGAGGYLAEVQDLAGKEVAKEQVDKAVTTVSFKLVPGAYKLRLTTLNRLQKPESATDWMRIHVAATAAPRLGDIPQTQLSPGNGMEMKLGVSGLAQDAVAWLASPSGKKITVPMSAPENGEVRLSLPPLSERGDYAIAISNPPTLTSKISGKLSVHYPEPKVESLDPGTIQLSRVAQSLRVKGSQFTPESIVVVEAEDGSALSLVVQTHSEGELSAVLPPSVAPRTYRVMVANAPDELPVSAGTLVVTPAPNFDSASLATGALTVKLVSDAMVVLAGKSILVSARSPLSIADVGVGGVTVHVEYSDGQTEDKTVTIVADQTTVVEFSYLAPDESAAKIAALTSERQKAQGKLALRGTMNGFAWASFGLGIAGVGATGLSYLLGSQAYTSYKSAATTSDTDSARSQVELQGTIFPVSLGVGIAGAVIGASLMFLPPKKEAIQASIKSLDDQIAALAAKASGDAAP
jgi:hypothetical protein